MKTVLTLFIILPSILFAQEFEKERKIHFGATTQFVTSALHQTGVNLMVFGELKKHQIAFGHRFPISLNNYYFANSGVLSKNSQSFVLDFHYRYFLLERTSRFNTFVQFSMEFNKRKDDVVFYYDPNASGPEIDPSSTSQSTYAPTFENSFNGTSNSRGTKLGLYIGIGEEVKIYKGLFATVNLGFGKIVGSSNWTITDTDKSEVVYVQNSNSYWSKTVAMTFSTGIGYRF